MIGQAQKIKMMQNLGIRYKCVYIFSNINIISYVSDSYDGDITNLKASMSSISLISIVNDPSIVLMLYYLTEIITNGIEPAGSL